MKVLVEPVEADSAVLGVLRREAALLAWVGHPGLPEVHEVGRAGDSAYLIMDLIEGTSLAAMLAAGLPAVDQIVDIAAQVGEVLAAVHAVGLVHRDVKCENIMVEAGGRVRLIDFGMAARSTLEETDKVAGTVQYCAPEQSGMINRPVDARSDLYSLGVVLFEGLAGRPPFESDDVGELLRMHAATLPPWLTNVRPEVPEGLARIVATLLAKDPDDRYQTAAGLVADLRALAAGGRTGDGASATADAVGAGWGDLAPLVGRDQERARLDTCWQNARRGLGELALVVGGVGSGKTRLIRELAEQVRRQQLPVLWAGCERDAGPLASLRAVVEHHLRRLHRAAPDERDAAIERLRIAAGSTAPLLRRLSPALADVLTGGGPEGVVADDFESFTRTAVNFLVNLARVSGGMLLCLDDAEYADEVTLTVLRQLVSALADTPLLVVLTMAEEPDVPGGSAAPNTPQEELEHLPLAIAERAGTVVVLEPLGVGSVNELVRAVARGLPVDAELAEQLAAGCGVTPFEVQEYLRAVIEAGLLLPHWGTVRLDAAGLDALVLPDDVFGLILRRVDGIGPRCRQLLTAGAAIGLRFTAEFAAQASELDDLGEVADLLDHAVARMLVESRDGALRFVHDGIRRALLDALDEPTRRQLHQRIAEILDRKGSADPADVNALARHYLLGEVARAPDRAYAAIVAAGRLSLADCAPAEAVDLLELAGQLVDQVPGANRVEVDELLGVAYSRNGRFTDAVDTLERALSGTTDPQARARILVHAHEGYLGAGHAKAYISGERGLAALGRRLPTHLLPLIVSALLRFLAGQFVERFALHTADPVQQTRYQLETRLFSLAAAGHLLALEPVRAGALALRAFYPVSRIGAGAEYARVRTELAVIAQMVGLPSRGGFRRAEAAAVALDDPRVTVYVGWIQRLTKTVVSGDFRTLGADVTDRSGLIPTGIYVTVSENGVWLSLSAGYAREAQALRDHAAARTAGTNLSDHVMTLCGIATASALGRVADADGMLRRMEEQSDAATANRGQRFNALMTRMMAAVEQRDHATFDRHAAEFTAMRINPRALVPAQLTIYLLMADGRLDRCRTASAEQRAAALTEATSAVRQLGAAARGPVLKAHHRVADAHLRHLRGDHSGALTALARADDLYTVDAPRVSYESARLRARILTALGRLPDAAAAAAGALALAEMHGWPHRAQWIRTEFTTTTGPAPGSATGSRLSSSTAAHRQLLAALEQMSNVASGILDPTELTRVALDEIIRLLTAERTFMFLADADGRLLPHLGRDATGNDLTELTEYGSTLVERVRQTREPLVVTGTDEGAALGSQSVVAYGLRSIMVAPLVFDGRLLGVVYLDSRIAKGMFTTDDIGVLAALTTHVAAALETARAAQLAVGVESVRRERDLAETLRTAMANLSETLDPADVLRRLHATIARVLPADQSWLFVVEPDKVRVLRGGDDTETMTAAFDPAANPELHQFLQAVEPIAGIPGSAPPPVGDFAITDAVAWLAVPLRARADLVGLIVVTSHQPDSYGRAQVEIAAALANHGMTAYDNARLFTQAEHMAITDALTGLFNRRHFFAVAMRELAVTRRRDTPLAAVMLDIDHFKQVNDTHGHHVGDQVIRTVARRLAHIARQTDVLGRYGGEEFAFILVDTDREGAAILAERLRSGIADRPIDTDAGPLTVTISVGVVHLSPEHADVESLVAGADMALYQAKREGRNKVVVAPAEDS